MANILVVEDNPQNLRLTTIILEASGHTVIPAVDSAGAEQAIGASLPDLIILDISLPGKDGYTISRELRARRDTALVPILALSALAMPGDAERALGAGCTDYLTKPISRAVLNERVEALLRRAAPAPSPAPEIGPERTQTSQPVPAPSGSIPPEGGA